MFQVLHLRLYKYVLIVWIDKKQKHSEGFEESSLLQIHNTVDTQGI